MRQRINSLGTMFLKTLHLRSFRNYRDHQVNFNAQKTILVGNNAQGKSNLLEAVELLATLRSHRTSRDRELVLEGQQAAQIEGYFDRTYGSAELALMVRQQGRRTVSVNKEIVRRQIDFLGNLNAVQFSSLDLDLVRGAPESRRNWLDTLLIQLEPVYAHILHQYDRVLKQRNAVLRSIYKDKNEIKPPQQLGFNTKEVELDPKAQLQLWNEQLAAAGSRVTRRRARAIARLAPIAQAWHSSISGKTEVLEIKYAPNVVWTSDRPETVQQAFLDKLESRAIAEQQQCKTVVGTHRDEIELIINNTPARYYGSQGQQRTLVLALKLAELKLIEEVVGEAPLLLLDDVLAELDLNRQNQLLDVLGDRFQTLITTTHVNSFDAQWLKASQILSVEAGKISLFS
jgi:DNA replication and repair protein RecF